MDRGLRILARADQAMSDCTWRDWMPIGIRNGPSEPLVDWANFRCLRFTDPFFQQTVNRALDHPARIMFRRESAISLLETLARERPGIPPTGFVFHLSRCGSTLVSRMLAAVPSNIVLSEPPPFDQVLALPSSRPVTGPDPRITWMRGLLSAWAEPRNGEQRLFVKLDSWHVLELPLIVEAFPEVPWIFLYRDPIEILVSHSRVPGAQTVPGIVDPRRLGLDPATVNPAARGEYTAQVLAQVCAAALAHSRLGRGLFVNYRELPGSVTDRIARHFGVPLSPADHALMDSASLFDAKSPGNAFQSDTQSKQQEASEEIRKRAQTVLGGLYERLEAVRLG
jgi:hypothetical protein